VLAVALLLRIWMAWANYGFVALDDYHDALALAVPAERAPVPDVIIRESGIRSPVPRLFIYGIGQTALAIGITEAITQVRFVYTALGLLSVTVVAAVWWMFARLGREDWGLHAAGWTGFHFLAVYLSTRTLLENLSLPFLTLAGVFLVLYHAEGRTRLLLGSLTALALASVFRFQAGVVLPVVLVVPIVRRAWRDLAAVTALGGVLFLVTGEIDALLRGGFHESLRAYVRYNIHESSGFGTSPWYAYVLLLAGTALLPLFVARYRAFPWREYGRRLWPLVAFVGVFVAAHSAVPHKEDRFMVPIMGAFLALLAPFSAHLVRVARRGWHSWRPVTFVAINATGILLLAAVPAQNNVIGPVRYLAHHPELRTVWSVAESAYPYPTAYSTRPLPERHEVDAIPLARLAEGDCGDVVIIRSDLLPRYREALSKLREIAVYGPGLPERLVIWINPENNLRRNPVHLFVPAGCRETT